MQRILAAIIGIVSMAAGATSQDDAPKTKVSAAPLTEEQVSVYRAVLDSYSNGSNARLNLADKTEALDLSEEKECLKGIDFELSSVSTSVVHRLDERLTKMKKNMVLVDAELQQKRIEENDPQNLMKRAIDDGEKVTEKQIGDSVDQAFRTGLFTLSEIVFDNGHKHAVLAYSFVCGGLCGHGNTIVLRKVGKKWKQGKTCRSWIS